MPYTDIEPLVILIVITAGLLGAVVGSFLNVCIYRLPREYLSIVYPGSHCPLCGKAIAWYDNIPILSWFWLLGACRHCKGLIRFRYVLVEGLTAALFVFYTLTVLLYPQEGSAFAQLDHFERWCTLGLFGYLVSIAVCATFIDIDYRIIPDELTYPGIIVGPILAVSWPLSAFHPLLWGIEDPHLCGLIGSILGILLGGGSLYLVGVLGKIVFRKDAMGFGDVKLMAMVGALLGWQIALLSFLVACFLGTILGIVIMVITRDRYTPFGPYLAAGTLVSMTYKADILHWLFSVWPCLLSQWLNLPDTTVY